MVIRVEKNKNYSVINNEGLRDNNLSWGAKGLLAYLLSLPDNWNIILEHLKTISKDGRDSTNAKLKELQENNYLIQGDFIKDKGKFKGYDYTLYETPINRNGKPVTENPLLLNTNRESTKELINNECNKLHSSEDLISKIKQNKDNISNKEKDNFPIKMLNEFYNALIKIYPNEKKEDIINPTEIKIVENKIKYFIKGLPLNKYGYLFTSNFLEEFKIKPDIEEMKKGFGKSKIHKLFKNALSVYDPDYYPANKSNLPKKLSFFISEPTRKTMKSHLLFYGLNPPKPLLTEIKNTFPKETQMIIEQCFPDELTIKQKNELITTVKNLHEYTLSLRLDNILCKINNKKYTREQIDTGKFQSYVVNFTGFIDIFLTFLNEKREGWKDFKTGIYSFKMQGIIWNEFKVFMETMDCPIDTINLDWYMRRKVDQMIKSGELVIPKKSIDEQLIEIEKAIKDSSEGSANRELFLEQREQLLLAK
jgi:hypothetical protein